MKLFRSATLFAVLFSGLLVGCSGGTDAPEAPKDPTPPAPAGSIADPNDNAQSLDP